MGARGVDHEGAGEGRGVADHAGPKEAPQPQQPQQPRASFRAESPEPPPEFIDPISGNEIMLDPVVLVETGQTYERGSIQKWFETCGTAGSGQCRDPLTGTLLRSTEVVPNFALKGLIHSWAETHRIQDIPSFSKSHSDGLKRITSGFGRVQLSPPRAAADVSAGAAPVSPPSSIAVGPTGSPPPPPTAPAPAGAADSAAPAGNSENADANGAPSQQQPQQEPVHPAATSHPPTAENGSTSAAGSPAYPSLYGAQPLQQQQQHPPAAPPGGGPPSAGGRGAGAPPAAPSSTPPAASPQQTGSGVPHMFGTAPAATGAPPQPPGHGMYPDPDRPMRTLGDKLRDVAASLQALQPGQLVAGGRGAARYHAWTLMQLAHEPECRERMLQSQVVPLSVYLLGQPYVEDAKPALAGLLQRLAGGVHALAMEISCEDRRRRVAASNALYFMGWLTEQIRWAAATTLAQQAAQQQLPANPLYALWRFWDAQPPRPPSQPPAPTPSLLDLDILAPSSGAASGQLPQLPQAPPPLPPQNIPAPASPWEAREEWEALAFITHMLCSAPGAGATAAAGAPALDVRACALPQVLAHVAASGESAAAQYAAVCALHALVRLPQNRAALLAPLVEWLGGADWEAAGRAAGVLWELCYEEGPGNSFMVLEALHSSPQFIPSLVAALPIPHPSLRQAATGLLGCVLFDGAGLASSSGSAANVDSRRYMITDSWRQQLLAPGSATVPVLLDSAQDASAEPQCAQLALTALANLAAARGTAAAGSAPKPQPKASTFDKLSAKLQGKLHGGKGAPAGAVGAAGVLQEPKVVAPGPRGAILSHGAAIPVLLQLVVNPSGGGGGGGLEGLARLGRGWGSGSYASVSPPGTPGSALSHTSAASAFSFAAVAPPGAADAQGLMLPPALLALSNLVTEHAGREQLRAWAKGGQGRQAALHAALTGAMGNRQLQQQTQELARRLLHELSAVPGPLSSALGGRAVPPPPRPAAYPTP